MDLAEIYEDTQRRVPATPAWTVKDLLAHITGNVADLLAGNTAGAGSEAFSAVQVASRAAMSVGELLDEWRANAPRLRDVLPSAPVPLPQMLCADVATHEQDIRGAAGVPGGRDSPGLQFATGFFALVFGRRVESEELPPVRLTDGVREWTFGPGEPAVAVVAGSFDLVRALSGRRSAAQIATLAWTGDPSPYIDRFSPFGLSATDITE